MKWKKILAMIIAGAMVTSSFGMLNVAAAEHYTSETLNHGTISVNALCEAEDGEINLQKGESVTVRVSPYVHVQYKGCETTPECPDVCGSDEDCFIQGKGCKCDTTSIERKTEIIPDSSVEGVVSIGQARAEQTAAAEAGYKGDGVFDITAVNEGTTTVTIDTYLRDWVSIPVSYTIHVTAAEEGSEDGEEKTIQASSAEAWTTHSGFETGSAIQTLFVELTFEKEMEIIDKTALLEEMDISFGSGLLKDQTDVELSADKKTLKITTSGWTAQLGGIFEAKGIWKNLMSSEGEYAEPAANMIVPNGIGTEIIDQVIATESQKASVTTKIIRPADTTRGMVHLVLLKNGQPVAGVSGSLDQYGGTETTHFHDFEGLTAESFTANFAPTSLKATLEGMYDIDYINGTDRFTITAVDSEPGDILEFHVLSYLNNGTKKVDVSGLEAELAKVDAVDGSIFTSESYAKLQDAAAKARLITKDTTYYAQTDIGYAKDKLIEAENALVKKGQDTTPTPATPTPETPTPATPAPATPTPATPAPATPTPATPTPAKPTPAPQNLNATVATKTAGVKATVTINTKKKQAALKSVSSNRKASIVIPATIKVGGKSYKITSVKAKAFAKAKRAKTVTLPKTITTIGKNAFSNSKIKTIKLAKGTKGAGLTIRKTAFTGLKTKNMVIKISKSTSKAGSKKIETAIRKSGFKGKVKTY